MGTPAYTSATVPFTPTKTSDNQVAGTASVRVPTTVMKMFGMPARTMTVTCEARFDVADSDVMFVLDTTGSMACRPEDTEAQCNQYVQNNPAVQYTRPNDSYAMPGYTAQKGYGVPETNAGNGSRMMVTRPGRVNASGAGSSTWIQPRSKQTRALSCQSTLVW